MFIVQLFIKYSSFIGGIKVKVLRFISPQVAEKLDCYYQALDGEPILEIQMCVFT